VNRGSRRARRTGLALLATLVTVAAAAPLLAPYSPSARAGRPFASPSGAHWLGTNDAGHDLLSELIFGARVSLGVGLLAALAATIAGTGVGLVAGYCGRVVDAVLMRVVDVALALPLLPLALVLGVFLGPGLPTQVVVITAVIWAGAARELRAQVLVVRDLDHVAAARAMGAGPAYALRRHVLPAVGPLIVPQFVLAAKTAIVLEASLAFLGLGDPATKSWGTTLYFAHARSAFLTDAWLWWVIPPGVAIALTVGAFALIGFALEERARPQLADRGPVPGRRSPTSTPSEDETIAATPADGPPGPLSIRDLAVAYRSAGGPVTAVEAVSLSVAAGEMVGLVGESGSGKSTVAAAATALLPDNAQILAGTVCVDGHELTTLGPEERRRLRGRVVALIPQEAMTALDPVMTIRDQIAEAVTAHQPVTRAEARRRAGELLAALAIDPARGGDYPHQFSGGMRQRVVIAVALANDPLVIVADEPTTGLDPVAAAGVLKLLGDVRGRLRTGILVVTHDLGVVERHCDRIVVMHRGRCVEHGPTGTVLAHPQHPHTRRLVGAAARLRLPPAAAVVTPGLS
jgi:peptide/nickel transport system ATP-binding protein